MQPHPQASFPAVRHGGVCRQDMGMLSQKGENRNQDANIRYQRGILSLSLHRR